MLLLVSSPDVFQNKLVRKKKQELRTTQLLKKKSKLTNGNNYAIKNKLNSEEVSRSSLFFLSIIELFIETKNTVVGV